MSETMPLPITCAKCGKDVAWTKLSTAGEEVYWWLNIPCECGSSLFKIEADPKKFVGSYGTVQ
jgi:hypothetical protein